MPSTQFQDTIYLSGDLSSCFLELCNNAFSMNGHPSHLVCSSQGETILRRHPESPHPSWGASSGWSSPGSPIVMTYLSLVHQKCVFKYWSISSHYVVSLDCQFVTVCSSSGIAVLGATIGTDDYIASQLHCYNKGATLTLRSAIITPTSSLHHSVRVDVASRSYTVNCTLCSISQRAAVWGYLTHTRFPKYDAQQRLVYVQLEVNHAR